jgi:hypothetical protein
MHSLLSYEAPCELHCSLTELPSLPGTHTFVQFCQMPECQTVRYRNKFTPVRYRNATVLFVDVLSWLSCRCCPFKDFLVWLSCHELSCQTVFTILKTEHFTLQNIFEVSALWGWARMSDKEYFSKKKDSSYLNSSFFIDLDS